MNTSTKLLLVAGAGAIVYGVWKSAQSDPNAANAQRISNNIAKATKAQEQIKALQAAGLPIPADIARLAYTIQ